ncbi:hypothetical protein NDU88_007288 [Pleurodeles waltl]|uniref:Uncharacterized protein n=1 Tax=Pleurodeles waltl TaxID=8319 RepID=A0AAV7LUF2_PLEWA|nr:hypothetical protein NDU88_007288 [Pleurodeles waltl]
MRSAQTPPAAIIKRRLHWFGQMISNLFSRVTSNGRDTKRWNQFCIKSYLEISEDTRAQGWPQEMPKQ